MSTKTQFVCQNCGYHSAKWLGKCPDCGEWNSFVEEIKKEEKRKSKYKSSMLFSSPQSIAGVELKESERLHTGLAEFDRLLGGGIVKGSIVLVGGEPGIGKSTLLLQTSHELAVKYGKVLYVSAEESVNQTKLRALRLNAISNELYVLSETSIDAIKQHIQNMKPNFVVVDSIQTIYMTDLASAPGSVSQVRENAARLMGIAKNNNIPIVVVGHVTKDGSIAGPRVLEHIVDAVLYFEGDSDHSFRILRAYKNRFGSTNEIAIFEMLEDGLKEVKNPSEIFLLERPNQVSGNVVVCTLEGSRPMLVEIQALTTTSYFGIPQRKSSGIDYNRLSLIIAVLEKRIGLKLSGVDVFVNVAGGIKVTEPAVDLGIALAIASSYKDKPISAKLFAIGEIGLGGEIRTVMHLDRRLAEAEKLGFEQAIVPFPKTKIKTALELTKVNMLYEAMKIFK